MVAAILFMTFFGFNDEGSHSVLVFVSVCGGGSHSAPDLVQNGYPLPPTLISRGIFYLDTGTPIHSFGPLFQAFLSLVPMTVFL